MTESPTAAPLLVDGWRMSVGTLTAIPVRPPSRIDRRVAGLAMLLAPLATLPIAGIWLLGAFAARLLPAPTLFAVVVVALMVLSTRAMHVDGLADTADGLSASYDRERALVVMRTGDVGPSGAAAIALTLALQGSATATLFTAATFGLGTVLGLGLVAFVASRLSLAFACISGIPAARPGGLGATVAGSVSRSAAATSALLIAVVGALVAALGGGRWAAAGAVFVVLVAIVTARLLVRRCVRRLGGITGDVLGAAIEISAAITLTAAAVVALVVPMLR